MLIWMKEVPTPYVDTAPHEIVPILLQDSFKVHMKETAKNAIQALGVEVILSLPAAPASLRACELLFSLRILRMQPF